MRRLLYASLALLALAAGGAPFAAGQAPAVAKRVQATLLSEQRTAAPGTTVWLALVFEIEKDWHTYWLNPGDSGLPTRISWQLPEHAAAGPFVWPVPERIPYGPLVNYGYSNEVIHLIPVTISSDAQPGAGPLALAGTARWLVCREVCIPESAEVSVSLALAERGQTDPAVRELFARARAALPANAPGTVVASAAGSAPAARFVRSAERYEIRAALPAGESVRSAYFFASTAQTLDHGAAQTARRADGTLAVTLTASADRTEPLDEIAGILLIETSARRYASWQQGSFVDGAAFVGAPLAAAEPARAQLPEGAVSEVGLWLAMLLAMAGGLILNLMPCVLPVISLKALSLVQSAAEGAIASIRLHGLVYAFGVILSFVLLGAGLLLLRGAGHELGWGFQLQNPLFVAALALLMFVIGLNLSGFFEFGGALSGAGERLTRRSGLSGSFFTGVLAVVVASPCTAPFMGVAMGFAMTVPADQSLLVFASLGVGLALPYLLISLWPALTTWLPRPGAWMAVFKQLLAFPMYATAIWLAWVLAAQRGSNGVAALLVAMLLVSFAIWSWQRSGEAGGWGRGAARVAASAALIGVLWLGSSLQGDGKETAGEAGLSAQPYSEQTFQALRAQDRAVFVNLTADWCITCLFNERATLRSRAIAQRFAEKSVAYLKGDWTNYDPEITALLERFGRTGVPLYLLFPRPSEGRQPIVLSQILTEGEVLGYLDAL